MSLVAFGGGGGGGGFVSHVAIGGGGGGGAGGTDSVVENSPAPMEECEESDGCGGESGGGSELGITAFCRLNKGGRGGGRGEAEFT